MWTENLCIETGTLRCIAGGTWLLQLDPENPCVNSWQLRRDSSPQNCRWLWRRISFHGEYSSTVQRIWTTDIACVQQDTDRSLDLAAKCQQRPRIVSRRGIPSEFHVSAGRVKTSDSALGTSARQLRQFSWDHRALLVQHHLETGKRTLYRLCNAQVRLQLLDSVLQPDGSADNFLLHLTLIVPLKDTVCRAVYALPCVYRFAMWISRCNMLFQH